MSSLVTAFMANDPSNLLFVSQSWYGTDFLAPALKYDGIALGGAPAMAEFQGRIYIGFQAQDPNLNQRLFLTSSPDGVSFTSPAIGYSGISMGSAPAMAAFQNKLYIAFQARDPSHKLYVTSSPDGVNFTSPAIGYPGIAMGGAPAMAVFQNKLFVAFQANDPSHSLYVTSSSDGASFTTPALGYTGIQIGSAPAMAVFQNKLYIAFQANDPSHTLYVTSSSDGVNFTTPAVAHPGILIGGAPSMAAYEDGLYIAFQANDSGHQLFVTSSTDGVNFTTPAVKYSGILVGGTPALAYFSANDWFPIGSGFRQVITVGDNLYGVSAQNGDIFNYDGESWSRIGGPGAMFVGTDDALFGITPDKQAVAQYNGQWSQVGGPMQTLIAAGSSLFGVQLGTGDIYSYQGQPNQWVKIGGPGYLFAGNRNRLFGITPDKQAVAQYNGTPMQWTQIGGPMQNLVVADNALYGIDPAGNIFRYNGTPMQWTQIGGPGYAFAADGMRLVGITPDRQAVAQYSGAPNDWKRICGPAQSLAIGNDVLYGVNAQGVALYHEFDDPATISGGTSRAALAAPPPVPYINWIWTFQTTDEARAGYDGNVKLTMFSGLAQQDLTLPRTEFKRGVRYSFPAHMGSLVSLDKISLQGQDNFFNDQWHLDTVFGYCLANNTMYRFDVNAVVPNGGSISARPSAVTQHQAPVGPPATVYIWNKDVANAAVGHASLMLSDGTYISWWPDDPDDPSKPMAVRELTFILGNRAVPAYPDQTYQRDSELEGEKQGTPRAPDIVLPVGYLNEAAIKTWWASFKTNNQYQILGQNCACTVYNALAAGGINNILPPGEVSYFGSVFPWTPGNLADYLQAVNRYAP